MIVIARTEAPEDLGFAVRLGHRRHLCESTSGIVLYAFQRPARRKAWGEHLRAAVAEDAWRTFEARAQRALATGHVAVTSPYVEGVVDLSCPVMDDTGVVAALTVPFIRAVGGADIDEATACLKAAAGDLSRSLGHVR
jgi:DNA-binding IclR family transcriptional regulator